jgi:hypothetical protein
MRFLFLSIVAVLCLAVGSQKTVAQASPADSPWKPVTTQSEIEMSYLIYSKADNQNNGIVFKLKNVGSRQLGYTFKIVFRANDGSDVVSDVAGTLLPKETKTGDEAGLFWIPFKDGRRIYEVGLRGLKVTALLGSDGLQE